MINGMRSYQMNNNRTGNVYRIVMHARLTLSELVCTSITAVAAAKDSVMYVRWVKCRYRHVAGPIRFAFATHAKRF